MDPAHRKWYWYQNHTWDSLPRGYPLQTTKQDHSYNTQNYHVFRFPAFFEPLYYEVFVELDDVSYHSHSVRSAGGVGVLLLLSAVAVLLSAMGMH